MTARPARPGKLRLPCACLATSRHRPHACSSNRHASHAVPPTGLSLFCALQCSFDIIYEARDLDLPQSVRDGFSQVRISAYDG